MPLKKEIPELLDAGVISRETADKILEYYRNKPSQSQNRLFVAFGILGAILVGLGIILIIAHNWDEFSRATKTFFAFLPLIIGQAFCGFTLLKKKDSISWRESSSAFLIFAIGASISLISQIYNIPGNISAFLLTWTLLSLPLIYIMRSSIASLLYLIGITYYAGETGYWSYPHSEPYIYWLLLLAALPHYYLLFKQKPKSNFTTFHHWFVPLSVIITLGTIAQQNEELMFIAYFSLFGLFYAVGQSPFKSQKPINNGYRALGSLGTIVLLLTLSFDWFWQELRTKDFLFGEVIIAPEFIASVLLTILAGVLIVFKHKDGKLSDIKLIGSVFIVFILVFIIGMWSQISVVLINMLVLAIGILTIREGANKDHLGILNYGLLIITGLVVCRFFDTDISFVIRGVLFVTVGIGFFVTNYWILNKRKTQ